MLCSVSDCPQAAHTRGWCPKHYARWRRHGDPLGGTPFDRGERVQALIGEPTESGCWPWCGQINDDGYGRFGKRYQEGQEVLAHRVVYELLIGPILEGMTLDHLCHWRDQECTGGITCAHRSCVNPGHLEPVTIMENIRRSRPNHCIRGHEFTEENTLIYERSRGVERVCLQCRELRNVDRRAARSDRIEA